MFLVSHQNQEPFFQIFTILQNTLKKVNSLFFLFVVLQSKNFPHFEGRCFEGILKVVCTVISWEKKHGGIRLTLNATQVILLLRNIWLVLYV